MDYKHKFNQGKTFIEFFDFHNNKVQQKSSSGVNPSADFIEYTKLNFSRMKRGLKTTVINNTLIEKLNKTALNVIAVTETWCGDGAQNLPLLGVLDKELANFNVSVLLRDEHEDLMERHLTNGGKSIPIFIFLNEKFELINDWGPRPAPLQKMVLDNKYSESPVPYDVFSVEIQKWYNKDKSLTLQQELLEIL